jgi:tRNA threonylcarbamoyladenosine biosynthesis protein TsaB
LAVRREDGEILSHTEEIGIGHAEKIAPVAKALFARASVKPGQLRRIGVTVGPGSFMGQRVGIAFAKGLAMGSGADTVALTTLEALAATAGWPVAVAIDARREQVYVQSFGAGGKPECPVALLSYAAGRAWLLDYKGRRAGSGVSAADPSLNAEGHWTPSPEALVSLTEERHPSPLKTLYLRAPDAKPPSRHPL